MGDGSFAPLRDSITQVLRLGGLSLLDDPRRFSSYVLDVADQTQPEVRLLAQQANADVLAPLRPVAQAQQVDEAALRTAQAKVQDVLENERFVKTDLAKEVADALVGGLADFLGVAWSSKEPSTQTNVSEAEPQPTPSEPTPRPAPQPTPRPTPQPQPTSQSAPQPAPQPAPQSAPQPQPASAPVPASKHAKSRSILIPILVMCAIAAVVAVVVLGGMGQNQKPSSNDGTFLAHEEAQTEEVQAPTDAEKQDKTYTIGTEPEYPPFEYIEDDGTISGIDADLLAAIAADQGFQYELAACSFDKLFTDVESGKIDGFISAVTVTPERAEYVDFSDTYYVDEYEGERVEYAFGVGKGQNPELIKMFNDGLANIKANGTYDQIINKYI